MNTTKAARKLALGITVLALCLCFSGCNYVVPITAEPTRKVDERLLGNWVSKDGKEKIKLRKLDDSVYIGVYNGDLIRAFHSDVAKTAFVSVQDIDSKDRKYVYIKYSLSADGRQFDMQAVSKDVVPEDVKDSASVQKLLEKNLENPKLFQEEGIQFTKEK